MLPTGSGLAQDGRQLLTTCGRIRRALQRVEALASEAAGVAAEASEIGHEPRRLGGPSVGGRGVSDPTAQVALSAYHARVRRAARRLLRALRRAEADLEEALVEVEAAIRGSDG